MATQLAAETNSRASAEAWAARRAVLARVVDPGFGQSQSFRVTRIERIAAGGSHASRRPTHAVTLGQGLREESQGVQQ